MGTPLRAQRDTHSVGSMQSPRTWDQCAVPTLISGELVTIDGWTGYALCNQLAGDFLLPGPATVHLFPCTVHRRTAPSNSRNSSSLGGAKRSAPGPGTPPPFEFFHPSRTIKYCIVQPSQHGEEKIKGLTLSKTLTAQHTAHSLRCPLPCSVRDPHPSCFARLHQK